MGRPIKMLVFPRGVGTSNFVLCLDGGMVDTRDLKSLVRKDVGVRVPLWAPLLSEFFSVSKPSVTCLST